MRCLILQGGGVLGAMQASALNLHLEKESRDYDIIGGVSVGALNGSILASCNRGLGHLQERSRRLLEMWETDVKGNHSVYQKRLLGPLSAYFKKSLYVTTPLASLLRRFVEPEIIRSSGRKLLVGVVKASTRQYVEVDETTSCLLDWVRASASFPVFLNPIEISGALYVDGGLRNNLPHEFLKKFLISEIDIFLTTTPQLARGTSNQEKQIHNLVDVVQLVVDALTKEVIWGDFFPFLSYLFDRQGECKIRVHYPKESINVDILNFSPKLIQELVLVGREYVTQELHEVFYEKEEQ